MSPRNDRPAPNRATMVSSLGLPPVRISRSLSEKQCSRRYASLVECKDANYSTTKSRLLYAGYCVAVFVSKNESSDRLLEV